MSTENQTKNEDNIKLEGLTAREREVVMQLYEGKSYAQIAKDLGVGTETIRKHATNIYTKLHVKNRVQAIRKCFG